MGDPRRRTGRTTNALRELEQGGWYVCHNRQGAEHARRIAIDVLKRDDIRFLTLADFSWPGERLRGQRFPDLDMDHHAAELATSEQWDRFQVARFLQIEPPLTPVQTRGRRKQYRTAR